MAGMRPFKALLSKEQALDLLLAAVEPVRDEETVPLCAANGRVLSRDVLAPVDVPPFTRSAMDGFAVRAEDTWGASRANRKPLAVVGVAHAGEAPARAVGPGEALQIATGAVLPPGADAVVRVENTDPGNSATSVLVREPVYPNQNVSAQGNDIRKGSVVLRAGDEMNPSRVGLLASLGIPAVPVVRRPRVAVIPTGNEIAEPGEALREGQVYNSNAHALEALLLAERCDVRRFPIIPDTADGLEAAILRDAAECDLVVLSGGSSVGERDLLVDVVRKHGELLVHGVQVKPGKPLLVGKLPDGRVVIGLPGYPTSCVTNAYIFVVPAARKAHRLPPSRPRTLRARLGEKVVSNLGRFQFLPVRIAADGRVFSTFKESGALTSVSEADGWIGIPDNVDLVEEGEEVVVTLW